MKKQCILLATMLFLLILQTISCKGGNPPTVKSGTLKNSSEIENNSKISATPTPGIPTASPTPEVINSNAWAISLDENEILASTNLSEKNLFYAVKNGFCSTVYKRNLSNGNQIKIFKFNERLEARNSGNYWIDLPPSFSLSPDNQMLAFIDDEGLKTYNLSTKKIKTYIRKIKESESEFEIPPKWSINLLDDDTFGLAIPRWSYDGKYISFQHIGYEGTNIGMVLSKTGAFIENIPYAPLTGFCWATTANAYVVAATSSQDMGPDGLFVSTNNNVTELENIASKHSQYKYIDYRDICLSPSGKKIAFTYDRYIEDDSSIMGLAITDLDGDNFATLFEGTELYSPFYDRTGNFVFCFQMKSNRLVLVRYDIVSEKSTDLISFPENYSECNFSQWTKENYLALSVMYSSPTDEFSIKRLIILDNENKKTIYASPVLSMFTGFDRLLSK